MLSGLKVVEFATYIAAPGAAGVLSDWGAEVIKIEPPGGDPIRRFFESLGHESGVNPVFELDNRGKRGVVLDVGTELGREAVLRLVRGADVFITNLRPASFARARLDPQTLSRENPRLVFASVTGHGLTGPDADRPGFDVASFWSRSGVAALTTPRGEEPFPIRTGMGDHVTSLATAGAILAALYDRERTGRGRLVETSLLRTGVYSVGSDLAIQLSFGRVASNRRRAEAVNPLANFFRSRDGRWLCLVPRQGSKDLQPLAEAIGAPDLFADPRFSGARARRENGSALVAVLDALFGALDLDEIARRLDAADIVWAPVQRAAEVADDLQARAAGCFVDAPDGAGGVLRAPASPARFDGRDAPPRSAAPRLGEHTREVLEELGFTGSEIAEAMGSVDGAADEAG